MDTDELIDPEDVLATENEDLKKRISVEKLPIYYAAIRVAPLMGFIGFCHGISGPVTTELMKTQVCLEGLQYSSEVCNHLNEGIYAKESAAVQSATTRYNLYNTLIGSMPAVLFSVLLGSWSDEFGRKIPMMLPFIGMLFSNAYLIICAHFPVHPGLLLISPLISSITGGVVVAHMAIFSYIGDYTTKENRALNIAVIDGVMLLVANGGTVLGGHVMQHYGTAAPFYIVLGVNAIALIYVPLVIRDIDAYSQSKKLSYICHPGNLFSWRRMKESIDMLKKSRSGNRRNLIRLILFCMFLSSICLMGDASLLQLFVEFHPFNWTLEFYTLFCCIQGIANGVALIVTVFILRKVFRLPDTIMAMLATISAISFFYGLSIATQNWMVYTAAAAGVLKMLCIVSVRSMLAGMVDVEEIGKIMAAVSSLHSLTPLVGSSIFSNIFAATNGWWSGLCFAVGAFLMVPVLVIFAFVDLSQRRIL